MRPGLLKLVMLALVLLTACGSGAAPADTGTFVYRTATPGGIATPTIEPDPTPGLGPAMVGEDGMILVYVPAGKFRMGASREDPFSQNDERPRRSVTVSLFWIDQTEVTNRQYRLCIEAGVCDPRIPMPAWDAYHNDPVYDDHPAVYVDWDNANAYCEWMDRKLPTEAEWEKAARGPRVRIYPWGNDPPTSDLLNYNDDIGRPTIVKSYDGGISPYGAYDMAGNVHEWVRGWYDPNYYREALSLNPLGPESGERRVSRGGSYASTAGLIRTTSRLPVVSIPGGFAEIGFRCVISPSR